MIEERIASIAQFWDNLAQELKQSPADARRAVVGNAQDDITALTVEIERLREAIDDIQEYVVAHAFDTTVGRRIDDFITERLKALSDEHTP